MKTLLATGLLALTLAGQASAQVFQCDMTNRGRGGFVGSKMIVLLNPIEQTAKVFDWAIAEVHGAPIDVGTQRRKADFWRFNWTVKGVPTSNAGAGSLVYTASLNTSNGQFRLNGTLAGADNHIFGSGTCKIGK